MVRGKTRYYQSNFAAAYKDFKKAFELNSTNEEVKHWIAQFDDEDTKKKNQQQQQHFGSSTGDVTGNNNNNNRSRSRKSQSAPVVNSKNRIVTDLPRAINSSYDIDNTLKLDVTSEDIVQMLLHPQKAARLPTMKLSLKSHQDYLSSLRGVGLGSSSNSGGPPHRSIDPLLTLPPIDQCTPMQKAYHGSIDLQGDNDDDSDNDGDYGNDDRDDDDGDYGYDDSDDDDTDDDSDDNDVIQEYD